MNTWFGFCYNQRSLFLKIIQIDDKNTSKMFQCSIICNSRKWHVLFSSLFFSFYCMHTGALGIVVLLIFPFCLFIFCIFVFFSETQLGFVPVPSLFLSLCCVQTFCFFLLKATCQPALSLTEFAFVYVCIYIFLENNLWTCSPICKNVYVWNRFEGKELNRDRKTMKIVH